MHHAASVNKGERTYCDEACASSRPKDNEVTGAEERSKMTSMLQQIRRLFAAPEPISPEAHAVRTDQRWERDAPELLWSTVAVRR